MKVFLPSPIWYIPEVLLEEKMGNRWLKIIMPLCADRKLHISDFPDKSVTDPVYDHGDRQFWDQLRIAACHFANEQVLRITDNPNYVLKPLDQHAVNQIATWDEIAQSTNSPRKCGQYCKRHHYDAQSLLDRITGDQDVLLAGFNPRPTEDDILDYLTFGISSSPPDIIASIRKNSRTFTTLGFCLWQGDEVLGYIAANPTRQNYGRNHMEVGLIEKSPKWNPGTNIAIDLLGLPIIMAVQLAGKSSLLIAGADDPPGFHKLLLRRGFSISIRSRPKGYGTAGTMIADIRNLATRRNIILPAAMVPTPIRLGSDGTVVLPTLSGEVQSSSPHRPGNTSGTWQADRQPQHTPHSQISESLCL